MWIFPTVSLIFGGAMAWTLYAETVKVLPSGWRDYLLTVGIACGSAATIITAIKALLF